MTPKRYTIYCESNGSFQVFSHFYDEAVAGVVWSTDSFEEANSKCIDLVTESGAFTYRIIDMDKGAT